jgi:hypothetical protein
VTRVFILALLALLLTAFTGALAVMLGWSSLPVVPGVLLVAYAAIVDPPIEGAVSAAVVGLVIDALAGTPFGVNVLSCVAVLVGSRFVVELVHHPRGWRSFVFVGGFSAAHALASLIMLFLFQRREGFGFVPLIATAACNAIASVVLFPILQFVFVRLKLEEKGESLQQRLASKS